LELNILSLSFPLFLKRLHGLASKAGVEILYKTEFHDFMTGTYANGKRFVKGIIGRNRMNGEERHIRARVTVDCTGWQSVVRQESTLEIQRTLLQGDWCKFRRV
jgi:flavin-dependent dehydrogenase